MVGPNLDELLAPPSPTPPDPATIKPRVLSAVENAIAGRMPAGILTGPQAEQVVVHTGHAVEEADPQLVIDAILEVVEQARA